MGRGGGGGEGGGGGADGAASEEHGLAWPGRTPLCSKLLPPPTTPNSPCSTPLDRKQPHQQTMSQYKLSSRRTPVFLFALSRPPVALSRL
eukprot:3110535-Rhodomonas_salina.1